MSQQFLSKYFKPAGDSNENDEGTSTSAPSSKNGAHRQGVSSAASSSSRKGGVKRQRSSSPTTEAKVQSNTGGRKAMLFDVQVYALCLHASPPGVLSHYMYTVS